MLTLFVSCSGDNVPDGDEPQTTSKTVLMYLPWSGDTSNSANGTLYNDFLNNISAAERAVKSSGGMGNNRLIVFICSTPNTANLIEIKYQNNTCRRDTIVKYTSATIPEYTSVNGIAQILTEVKSIAPASLYGIMVGCHGSGWLPKGVNVSSATFNAKRAFGGTTSKYQTNIQDFAAGISLAGMHTQFISFDDCYMAGVEVAYYLKDVTDYLIASTSEIMAAGMPYDKILSYLLLPATPDYNAVCKAFYSFYSNYQYPYGTLSAIDCSQISNVAALMKAANNSFTLSSNKLNVIQRLDGYAVTVYYDLGNYVKNLCGSNVVMYNQLTNAIQKLVPFKTATSEIYSMYANNYIAVNTFSGITISDATLNSIAQNYVEQTSWWTATH